MGFIQTPDSNTSLATSPAATNIILPGEMANNRHQFTYSPNPNNPRRIFGFDGSLFLMDGNASGPVSQPLRPALPNVVSHTRSPSAPYSTGSPSAAATPDSRNSHDTGYLDPRGSSSPSAHEMGISGSTTPGFETLEDLPDLGINIPELEDERFGLPPNSAGSSGYPPSPRLTASPHLARSQLSPKVTISRSSDCGSPIIKVEHSTPEYHPSPYVHQYSESSTSSGLAEGNRTIRRGEDGSWHGGLDPSTRGCEYLPFSLKEQEFEAMKQAKNADVEEWLRRSSEQLPRQPISSGLAAPKEGRGRSRSVSDFRSSQTLKDSQPLGRMQSSAEAGKVTIDGDEDDDSSVVSVDSAWRDGSLDDEPPPNVEKELPRKPEDIDMTEVDEMNEDERLQRERENDPELLPKPRQFFSSHPWNDIAAPVTRGASMAYRNQPVTANMAIMKFQKYAENIETASRVATAGSNMTKGRRNSAGDADKVLPGPLKRLSFGRDKSKNAITPARRPSIWGGLRSGLKRSLSNSGDKDREKDGEISPSISPTDKGNTKLQSPTDGRKRGYSFSSLSGPSKAFSQGILGPTFGQPSGLQAQPSNIGNAFAQMASPLMAAGAGATKPGTASPPPLGGVINRVRRSRSRSELQRKHIFGVVTSLMSPVLPSASTSASTPPDREITPGRISKKFTFGEDSQRRGIEQVKKLLSPSDAHHNQNSDGADELDDGDMSPQTARTPGGTKAALPKHDITPTLDGFAENVRVLAPGLSQKLVDRVAHEQCKRFKKLVEYRQKHLAALKANGHCNNNAKCRKVFGAVGVGSNGVVGVTGHKRGNSNNFDADENGFDSSDENDGISPSDGNVAAAQFPPGVPTPPVFRLPAELECPICFKTKTFNKPSDWTKHVHEDVQPFTCTFPECTEPKSFKRKADWVRHENERHRHLEWWTCNQPDCNHTCYRKDNFVQHLVREHKMPEPKVKTQKKTSTEASRSELDRVWQIVDACHRETSDLPTSEKCRFCGSSCSTWKKLTVHLARHMEAISLPVLDLIKDDAVVPVTRGVRRHAPAHNPAPQRPAPVPQRQQQQQRQQQAVPPLVTSSMEIDTYAIPAPSPLQVPTYNLTPPQPPPHQRSRSVPAFEYMQPAPLQPTYVGDFHYDQHHQPQQPYHRKPPQPQPQQVYSQQTGFDGGGGGYQYYATQQSYEVAHTATPLPQRASPMIGAVAFYAEQEPDQYGYPR